ncbi:hypothetical protein GCK32_011000 [Trichostrongylus colubriformis]|uniref:VWFA domain-containing protein n=1 Tax=Trichostrongylus colubriformis TaxID=6319 RepID=A0AAN8FIZ6_TRICO
MTEGYIVERTMTLYSRHIARKELQGEFSVDGNSAEVEEGRLTSEAPPKADDAGDFAEKKRSRLRDLGLSSSSCEVDIVLIIDRSESVEGDFKKEIELTTGSLQLFPVSEFASGRIRVGAVSFANDAKIELPLGRRQREDAVKSLQTIVHTGGTTSSVQGARLAMQVRNKVGKTA